MLKELFEAVCKVAVQANGPVVLPSIDSRVRHLFVDGSIREDPVSPPLRNERPASLLSLVDLYKQFPCEPEDPNSSIWLSRDRAVLVYDVADRREAAVYKFEHGAIWLAIRERLVMRSEPFSQAALIQFLKLKLGLPEPFVARFRALQWVGGDEENAVVNRGADKLGRAIRREVMNAADIPEEIVVPVAMFNGELELDWVFYLRLIVELDTVQRMIALVPAPDAIPRIEQATLAAMKGRIEAEIPGVPVYFGSPS